LPSEGKGHTFESCRVRQIATIQNKTANPVTTRMTSIVGYFQCQVQSRHWARADFLRTNAKWRPALKWSAYRGVPEVISAHPERRESPEPDPLILNVPSDFRRPNGCVA
jgi:hypothetical protein